MPIFNEKERVMRKLGAGTGIFFLIMLASICWGAAGEDEKMITVTGKLVRVLGIGGETTGWAIKLEKPLKINGAQVDRLEVNHQTKGFEKLENKRVEATGKLGFWQGIERGYWPVLEVTSIHEATSQKSQMEAAPR
jgi:hypothetical protein